LQKNQSYDWTANQQFTFERLKQKFLEESILLLPDQTRPFQIESDASKYAFGAVLMQTDINGDRHPCAYMPKSFSPAERNYGIYENSLGSFVPYENGVTMSKALHMKLLFIPTIKT
jgi:hypothetical protein